MSRRMRARSDGSIASAPASAFSIALAALRAPHSATVMPGCALSGATHEEDEIYYILSGSGRCRLDADVVEVHADQVIFIPAGCFHALDNTDGTAPLKISPYCASVCPAPGASNRPSSSV